MLVCIGILAHEISRQQAKTVDWVEHTHEVISQVQNLETQITEVEDGERTFILTGHDEFLEAYTRSVGATMESLHLLKRLTSDNPRQQQQLAILEPLFIERIAWAKRTIAAHHEKGFEAALQLVLNLNGQRLTNAIKERLVNMTLAEETLLKSRKDASRSAAVWMRWALLVSTAFGLITFTTTLILLNLETGERLKAERETRSVAGELEQIVNSAGDGIVGLDAAGIIRFVNPAAVQIFAWEAQEWIGQPWVEKVHYLQADDSHAVREQWSIHTTFSDGQSHRGDDEVYLRKDGTRFNLDFTSTPILQDGKLTGAVIVFRDITARRQTENALRESEEKFRQLADNITDAFWIRSSDMREVHYISPAFERIWGRSVESLYANPQLWTDFIVPEDRERVLGVFAALTRDAASLDIEYRITRPDGEVRWVRVRGYQVRDAADKLIRHTGIVTDITEHKQIEARLFQSQKLETVGKLAGGVAHEFNSILTAIIGQSELLLSDLPPGSPHCANAIAIRKAADLAAALTKQLLAYGRKQILRPETLNLNLVLANMEGMLCHLMGSDVDVRIVPTVGLQTVKADAGQIEQVIMNIAINAREAMPHGGKLTLETSNVAFDPEGLVHYPELKKGNYTMLAITDTGLGMSEEVRKRLFEPFFSTKNVGEGTGLGLATCYGIVKQSGGHISAYSELGIGTVFKVYLPQTGPEAKAAPRPYKSPGLPRGTETILLVEDDPSLCEMASLLLQQLGYTVLAAANGDQALHLLQQRGVQPIDLLFTDAVMPKMKDEDLSNRVLAAHPETKVLFASAYTETAIVHQGVPYPALSLLQRPFTPTALALKVRELLDA
jgi:PAS domain S-box-containing protein